MQDTVQPFWAESEMLPFRCCPVCGKEEHRLHAQRYLAGSHALVFSFKVLTTPCFSKLHLTRWMIRS